MSRLNSFDVAGRVDNTSMLVGTEVYKKVATVKNYKINAVRRFILEGLSPETGGLLKYHEISYEGDQYSTPAEFVNSLNPDVEIFRYHVLVVSFNEDKYLFTRQGVTIGSNSEVVEDEDFIALFGISAATIRELIEEVDGKLSMETASINSNVSLLTEALSDEVSARSSLAISLNAKIDTETSNRNASIDSVYTALVNETEARAELETQLIASIENEATLREAAITSVQTALVTETESRAELATELTALIEDETALREAAITSVQTALVTEAESRAELATELTASISDETTAREAAITSVQTAITNEATSRAELETELSAAITTEATNRQAAVNTLQQADVTEAQTRAALGTTLNAAITTEASTRAAAITSLNTAVANETSARTSAVTSLTAAINTEKTDRQAAVTTLQQADITEAETRAALGTTLTAAIGTETTNRQAAVTTLNTAIANESTARATLGTTLTAAINAEATTRASAITTLQEVDTTEAATRAALGTTLTAAIATEATNRQAAVNTLNTAIANESTARATLGTTLTAAINTEATNRAAAITTLNTAISDEASTRATAISGLTTTVTNNYNTLSSSITNESTARTTAIDAVASNVNTLSTTVNDQSASITATQTAITGINGKLNASYGLEVDAGGRIASMKLLSNGVASQVAFTADSFKIYNGTSNVAPFTVVNGQVKMTGVTTADTLITPGTGTTYPAAGWNGLSVNMGNDNALRFRHANGKVGIEMGIINGQLVLNWYNDQGVLIWKGGTSGIEYINSIAESITNRGMSLIAAGTVVGEDPTSSGLQTLSTNVDNAVSLTRANSTSPWMVVFPLGYGTKYEYSAGQNADTASNTQYNGFHDYPGKTSPFITEGWWGFAVTGPALTVLTKNPSNGMYFYRLVYIKAGKAIKYLDVINYRTGSTIN